MDDSFGVGVVSGEAHDEPDEHDGVTRRGFLAGAAGVTGAAVASGLWRGSAATAAERAANRATGDTRLSRTTGYRVLVLDRQLMGFLKSVDGGDPVGEVVLEDPDVSGVVRKHIGKVSYDPIVMRFGLSMAKPVYDWISAVLVRKAPVHSGSILACDSERNIKSALDFSNALITEIRFPVLDAASTAPAYITLTLAPQSTKMRRATGVVNLDPTKQRAWLAQNFHVTLGTLPTNRVSKVEAITIEQPGVGGRATGVLQVSNVSLLFSQVDGLDWYSWFNDFVILGNDGQEFERNGRIAFLSSDLAKELASIDLVQLGIFSLALDKPQPNADTVQRLRAEMYCEEMRFKGPGAV
ncbi:MAG TPA: phage tail protein [Actinomycetota bacterium]